MSDTLNLKWTDVFRRELRSSFVVTNHTQVVRRQQHQITDDEGDITTMLINVLRLTLLGLLDMRSSEFEVSLQSSNTSCSFGIVRRTHARDGVIEWQLQVLPGIEIERSEAS